MSMKKSVVTTYSFLVILTLIILAGWIGYTFFTGTADRQNDFKENLPEINSKISELLKETGNPGSDDFKGDMEDFLKNRPEIKGLLIYSNDNKLFYTRLESKNNRLMDNLQKNELFLLDKIEDGSYRPPVGIAHESSPLISLSGTALEVSYLHETFSPRQIYDLLLLAIYIISGLFLLTLIFLISNSMNEKKKGVDKNDDFFEPPTPEPSLVNEEAVESPSLDDMDFGLPEDPDAADEPGSMDFDLPGESEVSDLDSLDFNLPEDSGESDVEDMDFALPEETGESDLESMDFDLPEDSGESDLEAMDFDLSEEESEEGDLESMDFDLRDEESGESNPESMDFDLPEEESEEVDLESMDFDLPEEESEEGNLETMDFDLPEEESEEGDLETMDFDLPEEESEEGDLETMDFDLPEEESEEGDLETMDFDLPEEESEEGDLETMDFDLPEEESEETEEATSLDDGGDLFDEAVDLDGPEPSDEEAEDLPDEVDDLLGDISDEEILNDDSFEIEDAEDIEDLPDLEDFMADEDFIEEPAEAFTDTEDNNEPEENNPQLYSPRSTVCWENFIDDRLPQELDRASGENEDLSFVYLRDNTVKDDESYRSFADDLTADFPYRDLIFEWGDQGFAMILPNSDLVETLEKLDVFVNEKPDRDIRIGVTSRNGRLLDKDQLIEEASSAISRTSSDNKIVGFRADPERYRQVIAEDDGE